MGVPLEINRSEMLLADVSPFPWCLFKCCRVIFILLCVKAETDRHCMTGCLETWRQVPQRFVSAVVGKVRMGTVSVRIKVCVGVYALPRLIFMRSCSCFLHVPVHSQIHTCFCACAQEVCLSSDIIKEVECKKKRQT